MDRDTIIAAYRNRIRKCVTTKLSGEEQAFLIEAFINDMKVLESEEAIKERCQAEIALLEEGYSKETVAKTRLNRYRTAIQQAVKCRTLKCTATNSKRYEYQKKKGTEETGEVGKAHHHFAYLYMCYDYDTYLNFKKEVE